jgi:branched-chain amino acid transport system permease protein
VREVVLAKTVLGLLVVAAFVVAPYIVSPGQLNKLTLIPLYAIVAISLVVLTGWAGQISLGQFGIVGIAAAVSGGLVANHNVDFFVALAAGILAGVIVALLIGLPALRVQGLYLAVTTLAFGGAMENYFLKRRYWVGQHILPTSDADRVVRPLLWGRLSIDSDAAFYYFCLVFLAIALLAARSFRRNRSGRRRGIDDGAGGWRDLQARREGCAGAVDDDEDSSFSLRQVIRGLWAGIRVN